jgi:HK97 family phage major capsid protein
MAARIHELRAARTRLATEANDTLKDARDRAKAAGRSLTPEETKAQDDFDRRIAAADEEIACEVRIMDRERAMGSAAGNLREPGRAPVPGSGPQPRQPDYGALADVGYAPDDAEDRPAVRGLPALPGRTRAAIQRLYSVSAYRPEDVRENFRGTVAAALGGTPLAPGIVKATAGEYSGPEGGFAVTPDVAAGFFVRAAEDSLWLRLGCRIETMTSSERLILAFDDDDETDDAEASIIAERRPETVANTTAQEVKLRGITLKASKLMVLARVSNELGEDAPDYLPALEAALVRAISKKLDRLVFQGIVSGGLLDCPALITVPRIVTQLADTIIWENVIAMWARLAPGSHENSVWLVHPTTLPALMTMYLGVGISGAQPRGVFEAGGPTGYTMLTRPVYVSSRVKKVGDVGDIMLVDPSQVVIGIRRGMQVQRSAHAYFTQDCLALLASFRGDAGGLWDAVRTGPEGETTSPYIVLAAR